MWLLLAAMPAVLAGERSLTVVELFSSQGCAYCPPANLVLNELVDRDDLLALDYHVDYWDYTGWHDTFAKLEFGKRQRHYAKRFRYKFIYTPQVVVNGSRETVGSDRAAVLALIKAATDEARIAIRLVPTENGGLRISAAAGTGAATADLWLVTFERGQTVDIGKGEN